MLLLGALLLGALPLVSLLAAGYGATNTDLISVQERTREIGRLEPLGSSSGQAFARFSLQAAALGLLGAVLCGAAPFGAGAFASSMLREVPLTDLPGVDLFRSDLLNIAAMLLGILTTYVVAGTAPVIRTGRQCRVEVLHYWWVRTQEKS